MVQKIWKLSPLNKVSTVVLSLPLPVGGQAAYSDGLVQNRVTLLTLSTTTLKRCVQISDRTCAVMMEPLQVKAALCLQHLSSFKLFVSCVTSTMRY